MHKQTVWRCIPFNWEVTKSLSLSPRLSLHPAPPLLRDDYLWQEQIFLTLWILCVYFSLLERILWFSINPQTSPTRKYMIIQPCILSIVLAIDNIAIFLIDGLMRLFLMLHGLSQKSSWKSIWSIMWPTTHFRKFYHNSSFSLCYSEFKHELLMSSTEVISCCFVGKSIYVRKARI